jgi:hypothetical protein
MSMDGGGIAANGAMISDYERQMVAKIMSDWKLTPATFAHKISRGTWIPAPHLQYIAARVARAIAKGNGRIIISAPPRHGKSQLSSIYTPAWVMERYPHFKTILAGYGSELATGFSRQVRDIFQDKDNEHLLSTRIRRDSSRVEAFLTENGGGMYAVGLGGAITGRGANVLTTTSRKSRRRCLQLTAITSGIGLLLLPLHALNPTEPVLSLLLAGILTISLGGFCSSFLGNGNT